MNCEQALELISAMLDGELSPEEDAALQAHLELCPDCKRLADSLRGMDALLSSLEEPAPKSLKQGVLYRIDQASGKAKKPRRWFGPGTAIGAVAAALVLLVGLGIIPLNARKNSSVDFAAPVQTDEAWMESPQAEGLSGGALPMGFKFCPTPQWATAARATIMPARKRKQKLPGRLWRPSSTGGSIWARTNPRPPMKPFGAPAQL